jgi:succinoglycan biosynthesis protein ExoL
VLDIQPAFTGSRLRSRVLRLLERLCLSQVSLLVVSSPAFVHEYYESVQAYRGNWFLLENKLHASALTEIGTGRAVAPRPAPYKWIVSYVGLIRGQRTFDLITHLAESLREEVLFKFHGILTTVDRDTFDQALARNANMVYCGDYVNPRDLAHVYRDTDFVWALDLENIDNNSRWLLPCRLYEAGALGLPCLAVRDFEVGRKIADLDIGWTFNQPFENPLIEFFQSVTHEEVAEKRNRLLDLPKESFIARDDAAILCHLVSDSAIVARRTRHKKARRITAARSEAAL